MEIKDALKKARTDNNFTQQKLAEKLNISSQSVSKWENGLSLPNIEEIIKIADIYNMSIDDLVGIKSKFGKLKFNEFLGSLRKKYTSITIETGNEIYNFLNEKLISASTNDIMWENGGLDLITGSILYLLENSKKPVSIDDIYDVLELRSILPDRQEILIERFSKSSKLVQKYMSSIVESASGTFKGYIAVVKKQLNDLSLS